MCGWTKKDRIRNEKVRSILGAVPVEAKLGGHRLRWYGHVQRKSESHITRSVQQITVNGRRNKGRPELRWMDNNCQTRSQGAEAGGCFGPGFMEGKDTSSGPQRLGTNAKMMMIGY